MRHLRRASLVFRKGDIDRVYLFPKNPLWMGTWRLQLLFIDKGFCSDRASTRNNTLFVCVYIYIVALQKYTEKNVKMKT